MIKPPIEAFPMMSAVWSGSQLIVWGGFPGSAAGARYDSARAGWSKLPSVSIAARYGHVAVWMPATQEMLIWGGIASGNRFADGAAYSLANDSWRQIAPTTAAGRDGAIGVWSGSRVVIFGGLTADGYTNAVLLYDPTADAWSVAPDPPLTEREGATGLEAVPTVGQSTIYGGYRSFVPEAAGATYDGASRGWTEIFSPPPAVLPDPVRLWFASAWGAGRLWIWGGKAGDVRKNDGASYDPTTRNWIAMPAGGPSPRSQASMVWTGSELIIFGGADSQDVWLDDGKRLRPTVIAP